MEISATLCGSENDFMFYLKALMYNTGKSDFEMLLELSRFVKLLQGGCFPIYIIVVSCLPSLHALMSLGGTLASSCVQPGH